MKKYLADANIFLRAFLNDNKDQCKIAESYLKLTSDEKIEIEVISETLFEIEYVLRKTYEIDKKIIAKWLTGIVTTDYLIIEDRLSWLDVLTLYEKINIDLPDIFLFVKAIINGCDILSFDKDFEKLKKVYKGTSTV